MLINTCTSLGIFSPNVPKGMVFCLSSELKFAFTAGLFLVPVDSSIIIVLLETALKTKTTFAYQVSFNMQTTVQVLGLLMRSAAIVICGIAMWLCYWCVGVRGSCSLTRAWDHPRDQAGQ